MYSIVHSTYVLRITMTSMEIVIGLKINLVQYVFYQTTIDFLMGLRMLQNFNLGKIYTMMKF